MPRSSVIVLLVILTVGIFLRSLALGAQPLWFDEALTWRTLELPIFDTFQSPEEGNPPLYYFLLRGWAIFFGDSEAGMRSLSVLFGAITILATYGFVRRASVLDTSNGQAHTRGEIAGLLAATLVALSVAQIHAARQARMYSLATALIALSSWLLMIALRSGSTSRMSWYGYGLSAIALCYTHTIGGLIVAAQAVFAFFYLARKTHERASQLRCCLAVEMGIGLSIMPILATVSEKSAGIPWKVSPSLNAMVHETSIAWFGTFATPAHFNDVIDWGIVAILLFVLLWLALSRGWPGRGFGIPALIVTGLMVGYSYASGRSIYMSRYLTLVQIFWIAGLAYWVSGFSTILRWVGIALLIAISLVGFPTAWRVIGPEASPGMRGAVEHVSSRIEPGEVVLCQRSITQVKAAYYFRSTGPGSQLCVPIPGRRFQTQYTWLKDEDLIALDEALLIDCPGVWFLSTSGYSGSTDIQLPLPGNWKEIDRLQFRRDYAGEGPVVVWHFRVQPLARQTGDKKK